MTEIELANRYRTTIILLARHYVAMTKLAGNIKADAQNETHGGRISGLYCHARVINKRAAMLKALILEDRQSTMHFFETTNLFEIAKKQLTIKC